jgi:hypothetical protein
LALYTGAKSGNHADNGATNMMRDLNQTEKFELETLIDRTSLQSVLMALSEICCEKAEHVETAWQDKHLARAWRTVEGAIGVHCVPRAVNL